MTGGGHGFGYRGGERDHIVPHFVFNFVDAGDLEPGMSAQQARGFGGNDAEFGQRLRGRQLNFQPLLKAVFVTPDPAHFGPRVSRNHDRIKT